MGLCLRSVWDKITVMRLELASVVVSEAMYVVGTVLLAASAYKKCVPGPCKTIVEEEIGEGRCILFTTSASEQSQDSSVTPPQPWTYFSLWRSFVPLIHESLAWGLSGSTSN